MSYSIEVHYKGKLVELPIGKKVESALEPLVEGLEIYTHTDLKAMCEKAHIHLTEVMGYQKPLSLSELMERGSVSLEEALEGFYSGFKHATEMRYRRSIEALFSREILHVDSTLANFLECDHKTIEDELYRPDSNISSDTQRAWATAYFAFKKYVYRQLKVKLESSGKKVDRFKSSEERTPLTFAEWHRFLECLREVSQRDALVAEVLNFANAMCVPDKGKRLTVTLKDVLALPSYLLESEDRILSFGAIRPEGFVVFVKFSSRIIEKLRKLKSAELVFATSQGKPLAENQIKRSFARASDKAGVKVTVQTLRLPVKGLKYCPYCVEECVCI